MFQAEGENINKLEKADILELTVRHLHRITKPHDPTEEVQRFQVNENWIPCIIICHWNFTLGNNTEEGKKCGSLFPQSKFDEVANIGTYNYIFQCIDNIHTYTITVYETLYEVYEFLYSAIDH